MLAGKRFNPRYFETALPGLFCPCDTPYVDTPDPRFFYQARQFIHGRGRGHDIIKDGHVIVIQRSDCFEGAAYIVSALLFVQPCL